MCSNGAEGTKNTLPARRSMMNLSRGLMVLLLALAIANAGQQTVYIYSRFHDYFLNESAISHADRVFAPIRKALIDRNLLRVGYRVEPEVGYEYIVQYALAPVVLKRDSNDDDWILMNYSATGKPLPAPDLACVEDFGGGLALYKKGPRATSELDLGTVWQEQEGPWVGTWTRRGVTPTFDAVWKGPDGQEVKDEVTLESTECQQVTLYRAGTKGRYHGKISYDETAITNGTADWFDANHKWAAKIIRR
jgi:hypothetical protein